MLIALVLMGIDVLAWIAAVYLLVQWFRLRQRLEKGTMWVRMSFAGWIAFGVGTAFRIVGVLGPFFAISIVATLLSYLCPFLWLIGLYLYFVNRGIQQTLDLPKYDDPSPGVWPPPPTNKTD
jgi:uncharacterized membrane protein